MISIIIPVFNQAEKIGKCLNSILNQTYKDYEVIVVNDGSTDNINEVLEKYTEKFKNLNLKFKIIDQKNSGSNAARNRGAMEATGEYIIFCDADLGMEPNMLELMLRTLKENSQASYAYASFLWGRKKFKLWPFDELKLKQMPYIMTTSLIRKEHFPGWDEKIKRLQDWDLWLTMLENGHKGIWIDKILFKVETGGTISSWLPSFAYKFFPFLNKVKKYKEAIRIIKEKHHD